MARALEGGESDIVSSHHVYNTLAAERPDILQLLTQPIWYFDRKGEVSVGEEPYIRTSVFYLEPGSNPRVFSKYATLTLSWVPETYSTLTTPQIRSLLHPLLEPLLFHRAYTAPLSGPT